MYLLSANGAFRTILILLIIWQVLRLWMKVRENKKVGTPGSTRWTTEQPRPKGEIRIEKLEEIRHSPPPADVEDADFEVIKDKPEN